VANVSDDGKACAELEWPMSGPNGQLFLFVKFLFTPQPGPRGEAVRVNFMGNPSHLERTKETREQKKPERVLEGNTSHESDK